MFLSDLSDRQTGTWCKKRLGTAALDHLNMALSVLVSQNCDIQSASKSCCRMCWRNHSTSLCIEPLKTDEKNNASFLLLFLKVRFKWWFETFNLYVSHLIFIYISAWSWLADIKARVLDTTACGTNTLSVHIALRKLKPTIKTNHVNVQHWHWLVSSF